MSTRSAHHLVVGVLNLKHRHPRLWNAFRQGRLPRWQAEALADVCSGLGAERADWVDAQLASGAGAVPFGRLKRLAEGLVAAADPVRAAELERLERHGRHVRFGRDAHGSREIWGRLGSRDATALEGTVNELAAAMGEAGDERSSDERRAAALGLLGDPAAALQWLTCDERPAPRRGRSIVYVHLAAETLVDPHCSVARVEGVGPLTTSALPEFLRGSHVTVRPVLDPEVVAPVDSYEIPHRIREAVLLGVPVEAFPFSARGSRSLDLDHTLAFRMVNVFDRGRTSTRNLQPVGRRVHRAKTLGAWRAEQTGRVTFTWTSPLGLVYDLNPWGTRRRPRRAP